MKPGFLVLEDGSVFRGESIGASGFAVGEVVFNTAMTGYQEILTDPSYAKQIVTLTYPHIGNTGTNEEDSESEKVWCEGLIVRDVPGRISSWRASHSLPEFLLANDVVALSDIDTRYLTRLIREKGALSGCMVAGSAIDQNQAFQYAKDFTGLSGVDLAEVVSRKDICEWDSGSWQIESGYQPVLGDKKLKVVAFDFGVKRNILRLLADRGCQVTVVPAKTPVAEVLQMSPNGIFLSNGPGDPEPCDYAISSIQQILEKDIPIFGICLGYQLLALASGAKTVKMAHGHHGANHPVKDLLSDRVIITSQNHGFAVDRDSLPGNIDVTHVSLFDGSLQGLSRTDKRAFGFQGHPEASPGPQDCSYLFDQFINDMLEHG